MMSQLFSHLSVLLQVEGGGQSEVTQPAWVQLVITQVVVESQLGRSPQVTVVNCLQFLPEQVVFTAEATHLFWLAQVGVGGHAKVLQPCLVQLVMEQTSVIWQPG
jgi:hypothetical protein